MAATGHAYESCLSEPTYCRVKHKIKPALSAKLDILQNVMAALLSSRQQQEKMISEAKLLHIMIYKRNGQLRREKSLQLLKRVQACLKRASTFGRLFTLTDDVQKDLKSAVAEMKESESVYLPAQQTWSYLLYLQLQYAKLLDTNASYCIIAFKHLSCQLSSGMLIPQMMVFMAIVARIWLLSRSITETIQSCYSTICSLRQHIDRTNSDWKDPILPDLLHLVNTQEVNIDLKARLHTISEVPVTESTEVVPQQQHRIVVQKNSFSLLDETGEDIGVPVVMKRPLVADSDITNSKREKTGASKIRKKKERKIKKKNSKHDTDRDVSSEVNSNLIAAGTPTKKKRKRKLEGLDNNEMRAKKIKSCSVDYVKSVAEGLSSKPKDNCNLGQIPNAATYKKSKKYKKIEKVKLPNRHLCTDNADVGSSFVVDSKKSKKKNKMNKKKAHKMENFATKSNRHEVKSMLKIKKKKLIVTQ